jgi:hypothetical protein
MQAQDQHKPDHQGIAKQQAINGLPDGRRILLDVKQQEHHQLAGKQHGGTGRNHAERQGDVEDAGKVGFEKMHDAQRAHKDAEADAVPEPEERDHDAEIEDRFG